MGSLTDNATINIYINKQNVLVYRPNNSKDTTTFIFFGKKVTLDVEQ